MLKTIPNVETSIKKLEDELDDDAESIITNERYGYISSIIGTCSDKAKRKGLSVSDKIDQVVTNRILAYPFAAIIDLLIYYISVNYHWNSCYR